MCTPSWLDHSNIGADIRRNKCCCCCHVLLLLYTLPVAVGLDKCQRWSGMMPAAPSAATRQIMLTAWQKWTNWQYRPAYSSSRGRGCLTPHSRLQVSLGFTPTLHPNPKPYQARRSSLLVGKALRCKQKPANAVKKGSLLLFGLCRAPCGAD
jgi:hypothetical protein